MFENAVLAGLVREEWGSLPSRFAAVRLDAFVLMPNHLHFIVWLNPVGAGLAPALERFVVEPRTVLKKNDGSVDDGPSGAGASPAPTLGAVVGAFKSRVAVRWLAHAKHNAFDLPERIWQRNYYERIIRNDGELNRIRRYIRQNPSQWLFDLENPNAAQSGDYMRDWGWLEDHAPSSPHS